MFGFEKLAAFTHNLENAYDEVRNGRLEVSSELIDLTLAALDQIRAMLEEREGGRSRGLRRRSADQGARLAGGRESQAGGGKAAGAQQRLAPCGGAASAVGHSLCAGPDLLLNGANPLLLFAELRAAGRPFGEGLDGDGSAAARSSTRNAAT
jgi:two-component system chemotaxis sensor kinase CheA